MAADDPTATPNEKRGFQTTQWSLVMAAANRSTPDGRLAFEQLCERYWYPLYAHARQRESDVHRARDLIQSFFERLLEKNFITEADPSRGRFRTFLLASFGNYVANEIDKRNAVKRGGGKRHFSLDFEDADQRYSWEPMETTTPDLQYERLWARTLLKRVLRELREEYEQKKKVDVFNELQVHLAGSPDRSYSESGERLGISAGAVKVAVHRLRTRYRELLRREIATTVSDGEEVDDEIRKLFETFGSR